MSTLLGSMNAREIGQQSRPSHPVDAALWGLAERLAGGTEPHPSDAAETSSAVSVDSADHRTSHVRVVRLPQRAGSLPSVGSMGRRNHAAVAQAVGVPTKPAAAAPSKPEKASAKTEKNQRRNRPESQRPAPPILKAEFTILKGRSTDSGRQASLKSDENSTFRQESATKNEDPPGGRRTARRRVQRRRRAGVTVFGWLALTAFAAVAAAIALFAPSWF